MGWPSGRRPTPAPGYQVNAFYSGLDHPRWLYVLPNGDVLVAETNAPPRELPGITGWLTRRMMNKAGAGVPSANRLSLLRDADGDGVAEERHEFISGLSSPFGMALLDDRLYIANTDALVSVAYEEGMTRAAEAPIVLTPLPANAPNYHWTKSLIASADGSTLYVGVGSNSNIAERGLDAEHMRAAILAVDVGSGAVRVHASGLRNPVGMALNPSSGALWVAVNERDMLGSDLVPDYMTSVQPGGFYGWPWSYFGGHVDARVEPRNPEAVARSLTPDYALGAHTASLGLSFYQGSMFPELSGAALVGQHGSWNRIPRSGYRLLAIPFADGRPVGMPTDLLTGFVDEVEDVAMGRPVGVAVAPDGAILLADDVGNTIWRLSR